MILDTYEIQALQQLRVAPRVYGVQDFWDRIYRRLIDKSLAVIDTEGETKVCATSEGLAALDDYNIQVAEEAKQEGMQGAQKGESPEWKAAVMSIIFDIAASQEFLDINDVRQRAEKDGLPEPNTGNSWGSMVNAASKKKWIASTGRHTRSTHPDSNRRIITIWQSLIWSV